MIAYLDTHVVVWLAQSDLKRISNAARRLIEKAELLISPIVLVELEYLYEVRRTLLRSEEVRSKLQSEMQLKVCDFSFPAVAAAAVHEKWTRDLFDRLIVAHAKANGLRPLISSDTRIQEHYPRTVWDT